MLRGCFVLMAAVQVGAADLVLPERPLHAPGGAEVIARISGLSLADREAVLLREISSGNVPDFLRQFVPLTVTKLIDGQTNQLTLSVAPDYLAVGSDSDYCLMPLSPGAAQQIADLTRCILPTPRMVDAIYEAAPLKLVPQPIPPSSEMTSPAVFSNHNALVAIERNRQRDRFPPGTLVAGHKKDVVLSARLNSVTNKVAIYGWHQTNGVPIQPLYLGHTSKWVDYSQCIRLVQDQATLNGAPCSVRQILSDPMLASLISNEGELENPRYRTNEPPLSPHPTWGPTNRFGEKVCELRLDHGVRVQINAPASYLSEPTPSATLVFYALPNGNSIEQTLGKRRGTNDHWQFDIQHVAAQIRFVRDAIPGQPLILACLENQLKSWPAWRRRNGDSYIPELLMAVQRCLPGTNLQLVLASHSGGGSLLFGYLNTLDRIPAQVTRLVFLDSNYAYDSSRAHDAKIVEWLQESPGANLSVFAYHDSIALLNGTNFVSAAGGTWGRSHAMLSDLEGKFAFHSRTNEGLRVHSSLSGRVNFFLKENPDKKILHTVQVERNGLIHALLLNTPFEGKGYDYFGARAYTKWIE